MKRSQSKRSQAPLKRSPVKKRRAGHPRRGAMRDPGYLKWLRSLRCRAMWAGLHVSDARVEAAHGPVNGMSQKGPDNEAIPLCVLHHRMQHKIGWPAFEAKYGFSRAEEAKRLYAEYLATKPTAGGASPRRQSAR